MAKKFKVPTVIASFSEDPYMMRSPEDLVNLFAGLGMGQRRAKDSLRRIGEIIKKNRSDASKGRMPEGVRVLD